MKATKRFRAVSFRHLQAASLLVNSVAAPSSHHGQLKGKSNLARPRAATEKL